MLTVKQVDIGGLTINYAEGAPNGPPLLVLHGIPNRWQGMLQLLTPLEAEWHLFACDMRGHGKSGRASSYRAVDYFPDTAQFVEDRIGSPAFLMGHSGGAVAVLGAAAQIPELVRGLVLLDPPLIQRELRAWPASTHSFMVGVCDILEGRRTARDVLVEFFPNIGEPQVNWFTETFCCVDKELVKVLIEERYADGLDFSALLDQVSCPILMVYGEAALGGLVRESDAEFFRAHARRGTAVQLKATGHFLHVQQTDRVLAVTNEWIRELR